MKRLYRYSQTVPQKVADRGTELVQQHLNLYEVSRVDQLPEEAKVRLVRDFKRFFEEELPDGLPASAKPYVPWYDRMIHFLAMGMLRVFGRRAGVWTIGLSLMVVLPTSQSLVVYPGVFVVFVLLASWLIVSTYSEVGHCI